MNEREKRKHLQERQLIYFSGLLEVINMRNGDEKNFYNLVFCLKIINMKRGEKKKHLIINREKYLTRTLFNLFFCLWKLLMYEAETSNEKIRWTRRKKKKKNTRTLFNLPFCLLKIINMRNAKTSKKKYIIIY